MLETNLCSDSQTTVAELVEGSGSRGGLELHDKNVRPRVSVEWESSVS